MLDPEQFKQSMVITGRATRSGGLPPIAPVQPAGVTPESYLAEKQERQQAKAQQVASAPKPAPYSFGGSMMDLAKKTAAIPIAAGKFLSSSEQKYGKILGDSIAANTGTTDSAIENEMKTRDMQMRVADQIAQNRKEGKDVSHLEYLLDKSRATMQTATEEVAQTSEGSTATNEEAIGASIGVGLDLASAGLSRGIVNGGARVFGKEVAGEAAQGVGTGIVKNVLPADKTIGEIAKGTGKAMLKGAGVGSAYGVAQGMQENEDVSGVAGRAAVGGALGAAIPLAAGMISMGKQTLRPSLGAAQKKIAKSYENYFYGGKESTAKLAKKAGENNPIEFLTAKAHSGDPVNLGTRTEGGTLGMGGKTVRDTVEAQAQLSDEASRLKEMTRDAFRVSPERISLAEAEADAIAHAASDAGINKKGDVPAMVKRIRAVFNDMRQSPLYQGGALTLEQVDDLKSGQWEKASRKFINSGQVPIDAEAHYMVGKSLQQSIENKIPEGPVKEINKYIGQHLEAIRQLEKLDGTTATGKVGFGMARATGAIIGGHGGPVSSIAGAQLGQKAAEVASHFNANDPFVMNRLLQEAKKDPEVVTAFAKYLEEAMQSPTVQRNAAGQLENLATKIPGGLAPGVLDLRNTSAIRGGATKLPIQDVDAQRAADWAARQAKQVPPQNPLKKSIPIGGGGIMNKPTP